MDRDEAKFIQIFGQIDAGSRLNLWRSTEERDRDVDAASGLLDLVTGAALPPVFRKIVTAKDDVGGSKLKVGRSVDGDFHLIPVAEQIEKSGCEGGTIDFVNDTDVLLVVAIKAKTRASFRWGDHVDSEAEVLSKTVCEAALSSSTGSNEENGSWLSSSRLNL